MARTTRELLLILFATIAIGGTIVLLLQLLRPELQWLAVMFSAFAAVGLKGDQ